MPTTNLNSLTACDPNLNATVSASAGSGKTWLLITRIVRLLLDGAEPGNIIALTFTRKAAGEMQIRLNERLFEMATASDQQLDALLQMIDAEINDKNRQIATGLYEKLMHSLYPVRIQTFHAFCQDILSRFPLEANIPPGFELLEDSSLLERQAWQMLFDEAATQDDTQAATAIRLNTELDAIMAFCNGPDNTLTALRSFLAQRSDWWAYTRHTKKPVDFACNTLTKLLQLDQQAFKKNDGPIERFFNHSNKQNILVFANLLREIKNATSERHANTVDKVFATQNQKQNSESQFLLIKSAFLKKDGEPLIQGRKYSAAMEKKLGTENTEKFIALHEAISTQILQTNEQLKRLLSLKINTAWYFSGNRYVEIYQQLKNQMRLLDFTDLEWKCYELLQHADNAQWVQYKIDQRIDHILIDEFQDTNPTQWHLLSPILEEIAADPEQRPRSVFLVGDEKQSIYSFRRANPALQTQASQWLKESLHAKATPLDFSRRSSEAIIFCVNQIFQQPAIQAVMTSFTTHGTHLDTLPGKVVLAELFEAVEQDATDEPATNNPVFFRNPLQQAREISVTSLRHNEAQYIAKQIKQLITDQQAITENDIIRPIIYSDVLILMRNRTHIEIYEDALKQLGIPYVGSKKGGLLDNLEIQDLNCLLNTLITPFNNLALAQILKSPIFNASDDDLIFLARNSQETHWYQRLLLAANGDTELSHALQRAAKLLPHWQQLAEHLPVHDALDKIFSEGNIINRYIAANKPANKQKVAANCQRFLELSLETDSGRYPSITRFLQRLHHLKTYSSTPPEEPVTQNNESRVRLMTIHGSKGLESPVVFLADCNSTMSNKNAYSSLVRWPAENSQPTHFQLQLSKDNTDQITQNLQQEKLDEQKREELNLLYVALTRAREQLYISGIASSRKINNSWYQIISDGLSNVSQQKTAINEINCKVYKHLAYDANDYTTTKNASKSSAPQPVDKRLLQAIPTLPTTNYLLAPSLNTGLEHSQNADASTNDHTIFHQELAKWRGVTIHKIIEKLCVAGNYPATESSINSIKQSLETQLQFNQPAFVDYLDDCLQEALATYQHAEFKTVFYPAPGAQVFNEMPLIYQHKKQGVLGIIDRLIKSENEIMLIDYKSHQLLKSETAQSVALQFSTQMDYYRQGIEKLWPGQNIKAGILFTYHQQLIWLD